MDVAFLSEDPEDQDIWASLAEKAVLRDLEKENKACLHNGLLKQVGSPDSSD